MPINKDAYSRYKIIDARLRASAKGAPTLKALVDAVNAKLGKYVSERTVQKDLYNMRYDEHLGYNAPIDYDRTTKSYSYSESHYSIDAMPLGENDLAGLHMAIGILEQFKDLPALKQFEEAIQRIAGTISSSRAQNADYHNFIQLDRPPRYVGIEHMQAIVDCIREQRVMKLQYQSFARKQPKQHVIHPYLIKEYRGRLYLVAMDIAAGKMPMFLLFAFDRIVGLTETYENFKAEKIDREAYFKHTLGVGFSAMDPVEIVIAFEPTQAAYVKSQLLHSSQVITSDTPEKLVISLKLVINIELKMKILEFGSGAKVLAPADLVQWFTDEAKALARTYKKA